MFCRSHSLEHLATSFRTKYTHEFGSANHAVRCLPHHVSILSRSLASAGTDAFAGFIACERISSKGILDAKRRPLPSHIMRQQRKASSRLPEPQSSWMRPSQPLAPAVSHQNGKSSSLGWASRRRKKLSKRRGAEVYREFANTLLS